MLRDKPASWFVAMTIFAATVLQLAVATFIRDGTELDTAYEDTLGDMALGMLGALIAGLLTAWRSQLN